MASAEEAWRRRRKQRGLEVLTATEIWAWLGVGRQFLLFHLLYLDLISSLLLFDLKCFSFFFFSFLHKQMSSREHLWKIDANRLRKGSTRLGFLAC